MNNNLKGLLFISILLFLVPKISSCQPEDTVFVASHHQTSNYDIAIFPDHYVLKAFNNRFTPTMEEVEQAERALSRDLWRLNGAKMNQSRDKLIHTRLSRYKRQYFGYINKDEEKILLINAFYYKAPKYNKRVVWLNDIIENVNGGSNYWNVKYNITKNRLFDLKVNSTLSQSKE